MDFFKRLIDFFTMGSDHPIRRLLAYYLVLAVVVAALMYAFPVVDQVMGGASFEQVVSGPQVLEDGLRQEMSGGFDNIPSPRIELALRTLISLLGALVLMLPVSWVYMSTRYNKGHDQQVAQSIIFLPLVVTGIILVVQNSLALAFSLAGVVAAVRYRSTLRDSRDVVFIFLSIAVGLAAGVQVLVVATILSVLFNFLLLFTWRYDFGRSVLKPTAASQWNEPLRQLAEPRASGSVPDRDLVLALDQKQALALAERFGRVQKILGPQGKKPRYNAVLSVTTEKLSEAQSGVADALDQVAKRWRLDQVVTNVGKPSVLHYLVRIRKSTSKDDLLTAIRTKAMDTITGADLQVAEDTKGDKRGTS